MANDGTLAGLNTPDASGRQALGQEILEAANAAVQSMNANYSGNFLFAGADSLNVPFEWSEDGKTLLYRGVDVNATTDEAKKLLGATDDGALDAALESLKTERKTVCPFDTAVMGEQYYRAEKSVAVKLVKRVDGAGAIARDVFGHNRQV